jgi:DNA invertase Pin-like site-specific DNA recombinase
VAIERNAPLARFSYPVRPSASIEWSAVERRPLGLSPVESAPGLGGSRMKAIGYRRVSTAEQAGSGLGLEAQQSAIVVAAMRLGLPLVDTFTDAGVSGGLTLEQRPSLLAALNAIEKGDVLIIAKRDRLGRDVLNVAMIQRLIERKHARIVSAAGEGSDDDGPTSILMRQIIDAFGQYERALIRARTKSAMAAKKTRGERVGGVPFGYVVGADGKTLEVHATEQCVLGRLRALRAAGHTFQAVADELNRTGYRSRTGGAWSRQSVHMLARAA